MESAARMFEMGLFSLIYPYLNSFQRKRTVLFDDDACSMLNDLNLKNTPVLFLLPHVCLFETLATSPFFRPSGKKELGAIYRPNRNRDLDSWIRESRLSTGIRIFSRQSGFKGAMYFLRNKNWLTILFDQNGGQSGADFYFLNRVASLTPLPDLFSRIKDIRIVYCLPSRVSFFKTKIFLKEIIAEDSSSICQKAHEMLADDITSCSRGLPEWLWAHGKWKTHYYPKVRFNLSNKRSFLPQGTSHHKGTRIVIRLPNWLGDVVMSLSILRALRYARPDMYFIVVGLPVFEGLTKLFNLCEEYVGVKGLMNQKSIQSLIHLRNRYPECQLLFTNSLRCDLESMIIGSPQRFGLEINNKVRPLLTNSFKVSNFEFNNQHLTKTWEQMIQDFGFLGKVSYQPFFVNHSHKKNNSIIKVGIALGSSNNPNKRWPTSYYIELIKFISEYQKDVNIYLFGTKAESSASSQILNATHKFTVENYVGRTSISGLALEFAECSMIIGCDSGAVHLANAVGTSTLTIFGPTNHVVTCPCFDGVKKELVPTDTEHNMKDWSPVDVFGHYKKLIAQLLI